MNRIDVLNDAKKNKTHWSYCIILKNIVKDLIDEGSPITVFEIISLLKEAGHNVRTMDVRDVVMRLSYDGVVEYPMGDPYIYSRQ